MTPSFLSEALKRVGEILRKEAAEQITEYESIFKTSENIYEQFLHRFMVDEFSVEDALVTARSFFGENKIKYAAVDGTEYTKSFFDLAIFYGGAFAAIGEIEFKSDAPPSVTYPKEFLKQGVGCSSCIPVYICEVPEIDQTFFDETTPGELSLRRPLDDQTIVDNSQIANQIMTFAEYYLAYKLITEPKEKPIQLLLMDRSLSTDQAHLAVDTRKKSHWEKNGALIGVEVDGVKIDENDLWLGRYWIHNPELGVLPPRADYLKYYLVFSLRNNGPQSIDEVCINLDIDDEQTTERIERYMKSLIRYGIIHKQGERYQLEGRYQNTWERIKKLVKMVGDALFLEEPQIDPQFDKLMKVKKDGEYHWFTTLDMNFLTLFCLYMILEKCWRDNILLVGVTKDTAARDFKRQVIPITTRAGLILENLAHAEFANLPNTDRMLLQSASLLNWQKVKVPWALVEYDSCFRTLIPDLDRGIQHVRGAIQNKIAPERLFVKTYIQLSVADYDPQLRSNVLLIDRLVYPQFDLNENIVTFSNHFSGVDEVVDVIHYQTKDHKNEIQNLVMTILSAMTDPSIPEAFGHNIPLFIADNIAKWQNRYFQDVINSTRHWITSNPALRKFVFYMSTFRDRRSQIERTRSQQ